MSANLAQTQDGKTMFVSLREMPWHKQGTVIQDEVSGPEMLKLAHLNWDVAEAPTLAQIKRRVATGWDAATDAPIFSIQDEVVPVPFKKTIYRPDTAQVLGVVGEDYVPFQNSQLIDFFEGLVQGKKIVYECAGALGVGESVWVLARIPDLSIAIKGDDINSYMLIRTGHIGNYNLACFPTKVRVVCANTMAAASQEFAGRRKAHGKNTVNAGYKIRHTSGMHKAVADVQNAYQSMMEDFARTKELYEILAGREVTVSEVQAYFEKMVSAKSEEEAVTALKSKAAQTRKDNKVQELQKLWEAPTNQTGTKNTAFSLYNTFVEYIDHEKSTRCVGDSKDESTCRFESSMFGAGAKQKDDALVEALALVA
jgi:phage/plasmid-like protein (TIGR03299 family)